MSIKLKNNAKDTLAAALDGTATTVTVSDGSKFPALGGSDWFWATIADQVVDTNFEIVKVTAIVGNVLSIVRAQEGTVARAANLGDLIEQRITRQTLIDLSAGTEERIYLDEFYFALINDTIAVSGNDLMGNNLKHAPELLSNWDFFWGANVKVQLEDITNHITTDDLSFPTLTDMHTYITANIGNSGDTANVTVIARPYEIVDNSIPVQTKIYGLNRLFSSMKGRRMYTTSMSDTCRNTNDGAAPTAIFNRLMGTSLPESANILNTVWLGRGKKNHYGPRMFKGTQQDYTINFTQGGGGAGRTCYDIGDASFKNVGAGIEDYKSHKDNDVIFCLSNNNNNISIIGAFKWYNMINEMRKGTSTVMASIVTGDINNTRKAIVVKPVGIDQVLVQMPDFSIYNFEMVFFNDHTQNHIYLSSFTGKGDFTYTDFDDNGSKMRIDSAEWLNTSVNNKATHLAEQQRVNGMVWNTVRFRLRNKATGKISKLSYSGIETVNTKAINAKIMRIKSYEK